MNDWYILDKQRRVIRVGSVEEWAQGFNDQPSRIVKQEYVLDIFVSTVFLGLDHSWDITGEQPPVLWETMVFGGDKMDQDCQRCSGTWEQAEAMHARMLAEVKASITWKCKAGYPRRKCKSFFKKLNNLLK